MMPAFHSPTNCSEGDRYTLDNRAAKFHRHPSFAPRPSQYQSSENDKLGAEARMTNLSDLLHNTYKHTPSVYHQVAPRFLSTPDTCNMSFGEATYFASTTAEASQCTFLPIFPLEKEVQPGRSYTPPQSPTSIKKTSPAFSARTSTTFDSLDSIPSPFEVMHSFSGSGKSLSYSTQFHSGDASGFRPTWITPRDISVCGYLESGRKYTQQSSKSPSFELSSPIKKVQLFSAREDDPMRKSRVKTELCMNYIKRTLCPFGSNCTYAHGEEELQLTKLMDLHRAGLADCATYRTKPCLTWVSTGSCPFGKRCSAIHDPRIAGSEQSWLPHTETQGNTIATDINVDALHQKRLETILYDNPFGSLASSRDDFEHIYSFVCNSKNPSSIKAKSKKPEIAEHHKISIALQMRGDSDFQFKFRPQHIIFDELCMVLQQRAFRLIKDCVVEIPMDIFNSHSVKDIVTVREIAFGPDCDPSIRGVGLWFNISEKEVTLCTPQQAKRYRWKSRGSLKQKDQAHKTTQLSMFDTRDSFVMIRPMDNDAYQLTTAMLAHRLKVVLAGRTAMISERSTALSELADKENCLKARFDKYRLHWKSWKWSVAEGRETAVDEHTPVPKVDDEYIPYLLLTDYNTSQNLKATFTVDIWQHFAETTFGDNEMADDSFDSEIFAATSVGRLCVFKSLTNGSSGRYQGNRKIPLLTKCDPETNKDCRRRSPVCVTATKAWKSLLLHPCSHDPSSNSDWEIVRNHFQASRSRRVLSILQA